MCEQGRFFFVFVFSVFFRGRNRVVEFFWCMRPAFVQFDIQTNKCTIYIYIYIYVQNFIFGVWLTVHRSSIWILYILSTGTCFDASASSSESLNLVLCLRKFLLNYLFTYSTEQSRWEANRFSASQEIPHLLWNPKVHYRIHKCPPNVPILSQPDTVHNPAFNFLKIQFNIFPSMSASSKCLSPSGFHHQTPAYASPLPKTCYMPHQINFSQF